MEYGPVISYLISFSALTSHNLILYQSPVTIVPFIELDNLQPAIEPQ